MRQALVLALWSTTVLAGPCKPSRPSTPSSHSALPGTDYPIFPGAPSSHHDLTTLSQDTALQTSTVSVNDGNRDSQLSLPSISSESSWSTPEIPSDSIGLPVGSLTDSPVSLSSSAPPGEQSQGTGTHIQASSGVVHNSETSFQDLGSTEQIPVTKPGSVPGDASAGASGTATASNQDGTTQNVPATGTSLTFTGGVSGDISSTGLFSTREPKTTGGSQEATTDRSATTSDGYGASISTATSDLQEVISSGLKTSATSREDAEDSSVHLTKTAPASITTTYPNDVETSGLNSGNFTPALPENTASNGQTFGHGDLSPTSNSGELTESQSFTVPTRSDDTRSTTTGLQDAISGSPNTSADISSDQTWDSRVTSVGPEYTSTAGNTSNGNEPSGIESEHPIATQSSAIRTASETSDTTSDAVPGEQETTAAQASSATEIFSNPLGVTTNEPVVTTSSDHELASTAIMATGAPSVTANPITTAISTGTPLPIVTDVPPEFTATTVSDHPEWTSNTWITTTSGDSSEPTIVPVLVGCKKCGGSGSGIVLFHSPKVTGTWFKFPGLPKFSFPCIPPECTTAPSTSESGSDEEEDDDDKSSSTACSDLATVTDCFVACTTYTGPAGASITPDCSTTCTKTHTGCSVTGTTTTSSAQACGPSGDSECRTCKLSFDDGLGTESLQRRNLERRGGVDIQKKIGKCAWKATASTPGMPRFPAYPGGNLVLDNEAEISSKNTALNAIKRWWRTTTDSDCVPTLHHISEAQFPRGLDGDEGPSIDHVYEKSMLLDFWNHIIDPNAVSVVGMKTGSPSKINCDDIKSYGGINSGTNLIQNVFDAYPRSSENVNPGAARYTEDFIGMDQWTNGIAKALVVSPEDINSMLKKRTKMVDTSMTLSEVKKWIIPKLELLERLGIGVEMWNYQEAIDAVVRQNQRIYARLIDMDDNAKNCMNDDAVKNNVWSFAAKYKHYMENRFTGSEDHSINQVIVRAKTQLLSDLSKDIANAGNNPNVPATDLKSWKARLSNMADPNRAWEVTGITWDWTYVSKRDGSGLSCDRPIPSATSEESTTFATSTRMTSEESTTDETSVSTETTAVTSSEEVSSSTEDSPSSTTQDERGEFTDFPTLTQQVPDVTISTPEGSSCVETATFTQCALGTGGHGEACVERESCRSWINTETTSTTSASPTPTLEEPDPSLNEKHCYDKGQKSNYEAITYAAESFCRKVKNDKIQGPVWSNYTLNDKEQPNQGYHFKLSLSVYEGCVWTADYDDCMRYMRVPIDSCDCSAKGNKQGGWVENNCIYAQIDPNSGI
ncbi:hypothetical protein FBEOM_9877 [Fusarium beomiforme]|uniref:Uncharacterized protein n=1 Tax=Fusarium beomiforme TaxID=44412 RepID=A0A9P5ACT9_9HYPO|nr:hypothetical protein FBEOM_9877 [Fusarium beomiforme]